MDAVLGVDQAEDPAVPESSAPSPIVEIACTCPGNPHETDTVVLAAETPLALGMAAASVLLNATNVNETMGLVSEIYLRFGIIGWTLTDEQGKPEPLTPARIFARLPYAKGGYEVADRAAQLYSEAVMRPLQKRREGSSPPTPTEGSTSARKASGKKPPLRSVPSSPTGTVGIAFVDPE